jgi:hypothetical protein
VTRAEFAEFMAYLAVAVGKPIAPTPTESRAAMEVYWDLLQDLPADVLKVAVKRVVIEHPWKSFPSVAEIRQAAAETVRGKDALVAAEAWKLAWRAVGRMDPEVTGSVDRALETLPRPVADAVKALGVHSLCYGKEPVAVIRAQFLKAFEGLTQRDRRLALLPPSVREAAAQIGGQSQAAGMIGVSGGN